MNAVGLTPLAQLASLYIIYIILILLYYYFNTRYSEYGSILLLGTYVLLVIFIWAIISINSKARSFYDPISVNRGLQNVCPPPIPYTWQIVKYMSKKRTKKEQKYRPEPGSTGSYPQVIHSRTKKEQKSQTRNRTSKTYYAMDRGICQVLWHIVMGLSSTTRTPKKHTTP